MPAVASPITPPPPVNTDTRFTTSALLSAQQFDPVARHPSAGTGRRLVRGTAIRWRQVRTLVVDVALVVPKPVFARFEGSDDSMTAVFPVLPGVPGQRIVATADVAACRAAPQMHPPSAGGLALGAAGAAGRHGRVDGSSHLASIIARTVPGYAAFRRSGTGHQALAPPRAGRPG